ncbi:MAG: heme exporter protein CcmD [Xanthobacteraceae bacterium]
MGTTAHIDFIAAAYAAAAIVIGALILWVAVDYRAARRKIAELEKQGFTRRSASDLLLRVPSQKAKEEA